MRNYEEETIKRVEWIKKVIAQSNSNGIVYGASGGKDSALVGILCKKATDHVLGVMMPCVSKQNYSTDMQHSDMLAEAFSIPTTTVDLTGAYETLLQAISTKGQPTERAKINIGPRLRMTTLYTIGQSMKYLVAGTGNSSEIYMGYFTKWGDGAFDFNPIGDLTATEIIEFLHYLRCPKEITDKPPSAGLYEGQTDEGEMGVTYQAIDTFIKTGTGNEKDIYKIKKAHSISEHKRSIPLVYDFEGGSDDEENRS